MARTTADRRVRPSLWWLLAVPLLLVAGVGTAVALAVVTFVGVVDEALAFGDRADLPAGEVIVWAAEAEPADGVRLLGPAGEVALVPVENPRTVTADGVRWRAAYTATVVEPGQYRVEADAGRAALRGPNQLDAAAARRDGIVLPLLLATTGVTASLLVAAAVFALRTLSRPPRHATSRPELITKGSAAE